MAELVREVEEESMLLSEWYIGVWKRQQQQRGKQQDESFLGIPVMDGLLPANKSPVVELVGPTATAKTHLLYRTAIRYILPVEYHGHEAMVVVFDNENRFSPHRLLELGVQHVCPDSQGDRAAVREFVRGHLKHVHIYRPRSSQEWLEMLKDLPSYLLHSGSQRRLGTILVDGLSAFYWQDRLASISNTGNEDAVKQTWRELVKELKHAVATFGVDGTLATNWALGRAKRGDEEMGRLGRVRDFYGRDGEEGEGERWWQQLPGAWKAAVDLRIALEREKIRKEGGGGDIFWARSETEETVRGVSFRIGENGILFDP